MRFMASTDKPRFSFEDSLGLGLVVICALACCRLLARDVAAKSGEWAQGAAMSPHDGSWPDSGLWSRAGWLADLSLCLAFVAIAIAMACLWRRQRMIRQAASRQGAVCAAMLDALPHPVFCEDAQGRCLAANEAYGHVFGAEGICDALRTRGDAKEASGTFSRRDREGVERRYRLALFPVASVWDAVQLGMLDEAEDQDRDELSAPGLDNSLLAAMSHDLRTPMTGILGTLELLGCSVLDPHQRVLLRGAEVASHTLQHMLDDILNLARLEAGGAASESRPFDPSDITAQEAETWRAEGMDVSAGVASGVDFRLKGSEESVKHALRSLWRYAMTKGGASWRQSLRVLHEDDSWQEIEWLLEPMREASDAPVVGQACQTELVRRLIGKWCERAGLSWWEENGGAVPIRLGMKGRFERGCGDALSTGHAVLVVEDNDIARTLLGRQLELLSWDCDLASDGHEALEALSKRRYAMVLTDCQMPGIDGLELARRIRSMETVRTLPIIALTANPSHAHRERCLQAGMDDVLPKSIRLSLLADKLHSWLGPRSGHGGAKPCAPTDPGSVDAEHLSSRIREVFGEDSSLLESYLRDMREEQDRLRTGMAAKDASCLRQVSHAVSGMSAFFGAMSLSSAASLVERSESEREVFDRAQKLDACIDKFIDGMRGYISSSGTFPTSTSKFSEKSHRTL